jgi:hypothetical protein
VTGLSEKAFVPIAFVPLRLSVIIVPLIPFRAAFVTDMPSTIVATTSSRQQHRHEKRSGKQHSYP